MDEKMEVRLGIKDRLRDFWIDVTPGFKTHLFSRSLVLLFATFLISFGVFEAFRSIRVAEYIRLMTVTPANETKTFSISKTRVTIGDQYLNGDTFAIPLEIENFERVSPSASNYELQIQPTKTKLKDNVQMRLVVFGSSGRAVILVNGSYTGEPINVYLQSNGSVDPNVEGQNISSYDLKGVPTSMIEDGTFLPDDTVLGTMDVGGMQIPVGVDIVSFTVNPSAKNVIQSDIPFDFDSDASTLYNAVFAPRDRAITRNEKEAASKVKTELTHVLEEYEARLQGVQDLSEEAKQKVIGADAIAMSSTGSDVDTDQMNELLSSVQQEMDYVKKTDDLTDEERRQLLDSQVDLKDLGGDVVTTQDILKTLSMIRNRLITTNRQMEVADQKMREIGNLVTKQNEQSTSTMDFNLIPGF